ncbi:flagellar brake protein [Massilia sp. CCM 8695]|uniref:Flagellar brake protein YcgR n=1 Tax=Massilia frigida TaxID=2609281 RepID=A0ABX0NKA0_9BURK|nr:flagellar brake protein [Massilia frigida]NHZ84051.1 flagellar brake protein [Massilia frigida]
MQSTNDSDIESWHDFEVASRKEIIALLRGIGEKRQLVRMVIRRGTEVCVSAILEVDPDNNTLTLDGSADPEQHRRFANVGRMAFETSLDKIRILFSSEEVQATTFEDTPAFTIPIPETLIRLQRREFYRMATPVSNPVSVVIRLAQDAGGGTHVFPLADISCGGIAILDNKLVLGTTIGQSYTGCRIDLPDVGAVQTTLMIRNSVDLTMLNDKTNRRLGCAFVDISRGGLASVQKYITKLERERNARLAGLG